MVICGVIFSDVKHHILLLIVLISMGSFHALGFRSQDLQYYINDGSGTVHVGRRSRSTSTKLRTNIKDVLVQSSRNMCSLSSFSPGTVHGFSEFMPNVLNSGIYNDPRKHLVSLQTFHYNSMLHYLESSTSRKTDYSLSNLDHYHSETIEFC